MKKHSIADWSAIFNEKVLWTFELSKSGNLAHAFKYVSIVIAVYMMIWVIVAASGMMLWRGLLFFAAIALISCVIAFIALWNQPNTVYTITEKRIIIEYPGMVCQNEYSNIKNIKLSRSVFNRSAGTIRFKVYKGLSMNYQFANIDKADDVYDLLISLWKQEQPAEASVPSPSPSASPKGVTSMNDIEIIYDRLKDKHELVFTNTFSLNEGFTWDVPVICGESRLGRFRLYADEDTPDPHDCEFVFSVEYEKRRPVSNKTEICYTHWHPQSIEDAVTDADRFMMGKLKFEH